MSATVERDKSSTGAPQPGAALHGTALRRIPLAGFVSVVTGLLLWEVLSRVVVANPLPPSEQLDPALHDRVLTEGLIAAEAAGIHGKDVTPFLLDHLAGETAGASLEANVRLVLANARLAAEIASELAA